MGRHNTGCAVRGRYRRFSTAVREVGLLHVDSCFGTAVVVALQRATFQQRITLLKLLFPDGENGCSEEFQVLKEKEPERLAALLHQWVIAGTIWSRDAFSYAT